MKWNGKEIENPPNSIGRPVRPKNSPAGTKLTAKVIDVVGLLCDYNSEIYYKVFQLIQYHDKEMAYRFGYWRYNKKLRYWIWGQYTQMITRDEWKKLYKKALRKGFFKR